MVVLVVVVIVIFLLGELVVVPGEGVRFLLAEMVMFLVVGAVK